MVEWLGILGRILHPSGKAAGGKKKVYLTMTAFTVCLYFVAFSPHRSRVLCSQVQHGQLTAMSSAVLNLVAVFQDRAVFSTS
eukprot:scaffold22701_cov123-Cylindrotheca_fusiformis.AAC.17